MYGDLQYGFCISTLLFGTSSRHFVRSDQKSTAQLPLLFCNDIYIRILNYPRTQNLMLVALNLLASAKAKEESALGKSAGTVCLAGASNQTAAVRIQYDASLC